ncbi:hypothetical protein EC036_37650 [Enterobacter cloacae]|nr:hypothetical protein EC036_37650 [Enterobacter cloacae]
MMRVLSGDTVAQAKLHVPRKQISPFEIIVMFILFVLN